MVKLGREFTDKWIQAQKAVVALGGLEYTTTYRPALRRRVAWKAEIRKAFRKVDFIALPTLKSLPPRVPLFCGTLAFEVRMLDLQNTQAVNLAGVPALAMPIPIAHQKVPASLQLIGPSRSEAALLSAGRLVEEAMQHR